MTDRSDNPSALPSAFPSHLALQALALASILTIGKLAIYAWLAPQPVSSALCQWDCPWYLSIARNGYDVVRHLVTGFWQANWAFFPLYPMLVRAVAVITGGGNLERAALVASTTCFLGFSVLSVVYRARTRPGASPWIWVVLLNVWPYGFYFHTGYTEAFYAVLATGAMLALVKERPFIAGWLTAVLSATRPTGILLAAGIGLHQLLSARRPVTLGTTLAIVVPAAIGTLGLLAFMGFLYERFGDPFAFLTIQSEWRHHLANPVVVIVGGFADLSIRAHHIGRAYDSIWALLGLAAAGWLLVRRRWIEAWFCGATVIMACASGTLDSVPRYVAANPVFLFTVGDLLERLDQTRWVQSAALLGLAAVQMAFVHYWYFKASFLL